MKPIYHYTTIDRLLGILNSGQINPATANISPGEKPAVWLSTAPEWEHTATKMIAGPDGRPVFATLKEMLPFAGALARIRICPDNIPIIQSSKIRETLRIPHKVFASLVDARTMHGAKLWEWRAVAGPISASEFEAVEVCRVIDPFQWEDAAAYLKCEPA
jgi:hypothetical protein